MKRIHPEQEVSPDKAVPGMPEEIELGASGDNESDVAFPFVIISFEQVLPLRILMDFIKSNPRPCVPRSRALLIRVQAEIID